MRIAGERFGKLRVLYEWLPDRFVARCECGEHIEVFRSSLTEGVAKGCGRCSKRSAYSKTPEGEQPLFGAHVRYYKKRNGSQSARTSREYNSWKNMMQRAHWGSGRGVEDYKGRGIRVWERWTLPNGQGFRNFLSDMGPRPDGMTLDRKDVQGHYSPENCKWADQGEQNSNQRRYLFPDGEEPPVQPLDDFSTNFDGEPLEAAW
jgi:hypothetical protein